MPSYFGITANRADSTFPFGVAPMSIPLDIDTPTAVAPSLLVPADSVGLNSATVSTTVTAVLVTAAVEVLRMEFLLFFPVIRALHGRFRVRVPWQITAIGNAGSIGRIVVDMLRRRDGVVAALATGTAYNGRLRALDALAGFNENDLIVQIPGSSGRFVEGDDLVLRVSLFVTTAQAGAANATVVIHHDPTVTGDRLICETDWDLE